MDKEDKRDQGSEISARKNKIKFDSGRCLNGIFKIAMWIN